MTKSGSFDGKKWSFDGKSGPFCPGSHITYLYFADDNTLYKCRRSLDEAQCEIENHSTMIINWFEINGMKMNPEKMPHYYHGKHKN